MNRGPRGAELRKVVPVSVLAVLGGAEAAEAYVPDGLSGVKRGVAQPPAAAQAPDPVPPPPRAPAAPVVDPKPAEHQALRPTPPPRPAPVVDPKPAEHQALRPAPAPPQHPAPRVVDPKPAEHRALRPMPPPPPRAAPAVDPKPTEHEALRPEPVPVDVKPTEHEALRPEPADVKPGEHLARRPTPEPCAELLPDRERFCVPLPEEPTQSEEPSHDYDSWRDPERREAEREQRYDDAIPTSRDWETEDIQGRDQGRVRMGLYISEPQSGLCFGVAGWNVHCVKGEGDDRGPQEQFSPYNTRAYVEVDFERDRAFVIANPTCSPNEGCSDAKHIGDGALTDYSNEVEYDQREDGTVRISWELANARLPGPLAGASIDGWMELRPNDDGTMDVVMSGDKYPSWEVYYDDGCGDTETLIREDERTIHNLLPNFADRTVEERIPEEQRC
jgi:hypothetical protein